MEIPIFKCRASCAGKIMTNPTGKSNYDKWIEAKEKLSKLKIQLAGFKDPNGKTKIKIETEIIPATEKLIAELELVKDKKELSETCKQYLKEWILEKKYGRRREFSTKFTAKGNVTEQAGFQLIQDVLFKGIFLAKSTEYYEDDYFTGNLDLDLPDFVIDNKSSWSLFTFPMGEIEPPDKANEPQIRVYMRLAKKENSLVCYTLNDTPTEIIEDEIWRYKKAKNLIDISDQEAFNVAKNHIFTNQGLKENTFLYSTADTSDFIEIPKEKRLVKFQYERDLEIEQKMIERVKECQQWVLDNYNKF